MRGIGLGGRGGGRQETLEGRLLESTPRLGYRPCVRSAGSNAGVVVRDDHPYGRRSRHQARRVTCLGSRALTHFLQVVRLGIPRHVLSDHPTRSIVDRSRAIPYSNHGVERETRLELATLTLARYAPNSVFGRGQNHPINKYLPASSTGLDADHTGIHADHPGVHPDRKRDCQSGRRCTAYGPAARRSPASRMRYRGRPPSRKPASANDP